MKRTAMLAGTAVFVLSLSPVAAAQLTLPSDLDFSWTGTLQGPRDAGPIVWDPAEPQFRPDIGAAAYQFPNLAVPENVKNLYVLVTWADIQSVPAGFVNQFVIGAPPPSVINLESVQGNGGLLLQSNQFLIHWTIDPQPAFETISFLDLTWTSLEVGTKCVPTPGAFAMLSVAGLAATRRRR